MITAVISLVSTLVYFAGYLASFRHLYVRFHEYAVGTGMRFYGSSHQETARLFALWSLPLSLAWPVVLPVSLAWPTPPSVLLEQEKVNHKLEMERRKREEEELRALERAAGIRKD